MIRRIRATAQVIDQEGPAGLREQRCERSEQGVRRVWYEYYGTFAVRMDGSAAVKRVWFDGALVFEDGAAVDLPGAARLVSPQEVLFEDVELAAYGNRIPAVDIDVED